jgi:hypothetical protein
VSLQQDGGDVASSALLRGDQRADVDILSAQVVYRF